MLTAEEKARLTALKKKADRSPEEETELTGLVEKAKAAGAAAKAARANKAVSGEEPPVKKVEEVATSFDTAGATHVVTMRNGKPVKVWFKDGKELGVEDV